MSNITRSFDWVNLKDSMSEFFKDWEGFDPKSLVEDKDNWLLTDGSENYSLFEYKSRGIYEGHYLFKNARGREAVNLSLSMLKTFFNLTDAKVIVGRTPLYQKGALWLNKKLGFEHLTYEERMGDDYEVVVLTKERFTK